MSNSQKTIYDKKGKCEMSRGLNLCQFIGHVGQAPELKSTNNGIKYTNFSIAVNESWKGEDGQKVEKTEWINIGAWRKLAEVIGQYVTKGMLIYVAGKMETSKYDKDGVTHYSTKIIAQDVQFLSGGKKDGSSASDGSSADAAEAANTFLAPAQTASEPFDLPF